MSIFFRLVVAMLLVVCALCLFLGIFASSEVIGLLGDERKETIRNTVESSMEENRFIFFSGADSGVEDWLNGITAPDLIDYVAIFNSNNKLTLQAGNIEQFSESSTPKFSISESIGGQHLLIEMEIAFEGERIPEYNSLLLFVKSSRAEASKRVFLTIASILIFAILVIIPLVIFLTRWVGKPVNSIAHQIANISPETIGKNLLLSSSKTPPEFLPVINTVNSLLVDLKDYTLELDRLVEDRTSLRNDALLTLQSNERQKQALISNLSHDLKTPLAAIGGYLELVQEQLNDTEYENAERNIEKALKNCQNMNDEVNTILNITTAELDGDQAISVVSVSELVQRAIQKHEIMTEKAGNTISYVTTGEDLVAVNTSIFCHVLDNLLSNSNKYAPGGKINIKIVVEDNVWVSFTDEGGNLSTTDLSNLFEPKRRQGSTRFSLSGMGLFLCRLRVEHAGGQISAEQASPKGLAISFTLPNKGT